MSCQLPSLLQVGTCTVLKGTGEQTVWKASRNYTLYILFMTLHHWMWSVWDAPPLDVSRHPILCSEHSWCCIVSVPVCVVCVLVWKQTLITETNKSTVRSKDGPTWTEETYCRIHPVVKARGICGQERTQKSVRCHCATPSVLGTYNTLSMELPVH